MGGLVVFSIGVWTLSDKSFMERLLGSNLYVASAAILIATGVVVVRSGNILLHHTHIVTAYKMQ